MSATGPWLQALVTDWLAGATVKAMLLTPDYTQDVDAGSVPTSFEVSGTGYTAGGIDVTSSLSVVYDSVNDEVLLDCDDVTWADLTVVGIGAIAFYAGALLIAVDLFNPVEVSSRPFTYNPSSDGLIALSISGETDD